MNCPYNRCNGKLEEPVTGERCEYLVCLVCGKTASYRCDDGEVFISALGRPSHDLIQMSFRIPRREAEWLKSLPNQAAVVNDTLSKARKRLATDVSGRDS